MSVVVGKFDPEDWKAVVIKGAVLHCDGFIPARLEFANYKPAHRCPESAAVVRKCELPAGWVCMRESTPEGNYLDLFCPACDPVVGEGAGTAPIHL